MIASVTATRSSVPPVVNTSSFCAIDVCALSVTFPLPPFTSASTVTLDAEDAIRTSPEPDADTDSPSASLPSVSTNAPADVITMSPSVVVSPSESAVVTWLIAGVVASVPTVSTVTDTVPTVRPSVSDRNAPPDVALNATVATVVSIASADVPMPIPAFGSTGSRSRSRPSPASACS